MRAMLLIGLAALSGLASAQTDDGNGPQAGRWSETFTIEVVDPATGEPMPDMPANTQTEELCYSEADVRDPTALLTGGDSHCTFADVTMTGGRISLVASCKITADRLFAGTFEGSYSRTAIQFSGVMRPTAGEAVFAVKGVVERKHVGACKPARKSRQR